MNFPVKSAGIRLIRLKVLPSRVYIFNLFIDKMRLADMNNSEAILLPICSR